MYQTAGVILLPRCTRPVHHCCQDVPNWCPLVAELYQTGVVLLPRCTRPVHHCCRGVPDWCTRVALVWVPYQTTCYGVTCTTIVISASFSRWGDFKSSLLQQSYRRGDHNRSPAPRIGVTKECQMIIGDPPYITIVTIGDPLILPLSLFHCHNMLVTAATLTSAH